MNIASIIEVHDPSRPALIDDEATFTFGDLQTQSAAIRSLLNSHGVGPEDRVAVISGNEPLFVPSLLGAVGLGAIAIPMKHSNPLPELERKLAAIEPAVVLVGADAHWLLAHKDSFDPPFLDVSTLDLTATGGAPPIVERANEDIAVMMLTSGVSGDAKVAMLSHHNLDWAQESLCGHENDGLLNTDTVLASLPFAHIFGLSAVLLTALRAGALSILQRRFDVDASLELITRHKITVLAGAPPMWKRWSMLDAPDGTFDSVRIAVSGAAALARPVFAAMLERHGVSVEQGYGLTETAATVTNNRGCELRPGSVGKPIGNIELLLVDEGGAPVEPGDSGEIVVRGSSIFSGYYNAPEATNEALTPTGWFWTGDIGVVDDDGYLFIVDRSKDLIIVSGFNVYPAEVEKILQTHPDVSGVIVVGEPNDVTDETVIAYVTGDVDPEALKAFSREQLTRYKCPTSVRVVDELPISPTGKPVRRELRP